MCSKSNIPKKRMARIGGSNDDSSLLRSQSPSDDLVSDIIQSMDISKYSKNLPSNKQIEECKSLTTNSFKNKNKVNSKLPKKYSFEKKHPLMEKTQRSLKYLKRNRTIPKQRAHVARFDSTAIEPLGQKTSFFKNEVNKIGSKINKNTATFEYKTTAIINSFNKSTEERMKVNDVPNLSDSSNNLNYYETESLESSNKEEADKTFHTSSDSEFESFIRIQKQKLDAETSDDELPIGNKRKKSKKNKRHKSGKKSFCKSSFKSNHKISLASSPNVSKPYERIIIHETDSSTSSFESDKISLASSPNVLKPYETIIIPKTDSNDNNQALDACSVKLQQFKSCEAVATQSQGIELDLNFTLDLCLPESKKIISKYFNCFVGLEKNISLENHVMGKNSHEIEKLNFSENCATTEKIVSCDEKVLSNSSQEFERSDSDDDCMIVCEIPNSSIFENLSTFKSGVMKSQDSSISPCCDTIDLEHSGSVFQELQPQNKSSDPVYMNYSTSKTHKEGWSKKVDHKSDDNGVGNIKIELVKSLRNNLEHSDFDCSNYILPSNNYQKYNYKLNSNFIVSDPFKYATRYCEIQKLDTKLNAKETSNISALDDSKNGQQFDINNFHSSQLMYSSSIDSANKDIKIFQNMHPPCESQPQLEFLLGEKSIWQHVRKAVNINIPNNFSSESNHLTESMHTETKQGENVFINKSIQTTEDNFNHQCAASLSKRDKQSKSNYANAKLDETPFDEMDSITASNIYDINNLSNQDLIPLIDLYNKETEYLKKVMSAEKTEGLKVIQSTLEQNIENIKIAIKNIAQQDPCFHYMVKKREDLRRS